MQARFLTLFLLLQALIVPVYTHDISPNYREARPEISHLENSRTQKRGKKSTQVLIFDTPSLAVESKDTKKEVTQKNQSIAAFRACWQRAPNVMDPTPALPITQKEMESRWCFGPSSPMALLCKCTRSNLGATRLFATQYGRHVCMYDMSWLSGCLHLRAWSSPVHEFRRTALDLAP